MNLQAIRLDFQPTRELLYRYDLGPDLRLALISAKSNGSPLVLVVREDDAAAFEACGELIVYKFKSKSKGLADIAIFGLSQIPFVRGDYSSSGRVLQSVRKFMPHVIGRADQNVYLIAVNAQMFAVLWSRAIALQRTVAADPPASHPGSPHSEPARAIAPDAQTMIELLPDGDIPDRLVQEFIGDSVEVRLVRKFIVRASENDEPVLILGDSGTGKEVVARLIHDLGPRRTATFVAVNCGAIPRELFESQLFGFEKGAHSTAYFDKDGLWRVADGGTLFLDEIADLALDQQVKILRVLDQGEVLPVGAKKPIQVNARILAATNKDLFAMVHSGQFREDLYYRLRAMFIRTPPLRAHPNDISAIAQEMWKKATRDRDSELSAEVIAVVKDHAWPGNVRELKTSLATVCNLFGPKNIRVEHLHAVFGFERYTVDADGRSVALEDVGAYELQCLRHLRQTDEVLRAVQTPLRWVNKGRGKTPENFRSIAAATEDRVNEFEVLCAHPLLFHGVATFGRIRRLKERLRYFAELMRTDPDAALAYWKRELEPEFADALTAVFEEVDRVVKAMKK